MVTRSIPLVTLANKNELFFRRQKNSALVQLCKLQSLGEGVYTGAGFAALGRHSFVNGFGDCRCHDGVHRT